jgi:hypothetical protein
MKSIPDARHVREQTGDADGQANRGGSPLDDYHRP